METKVSALNFSLSSEIFILMLKWHNFALSSAKGESPVYVTFGTTIWILLYSGCDGLGEIYLVPWMVYQQMSPLWIPAQWICLSFMIFSTFIIFLIFKTCTRARSGAPRWSWSPGLLLQMVPVILTPWHLPIKINNMQNQSELHLRAPSRRGCLCTGSTCTSCPARAPPWCLLPTSSSSTSSSWSGGAQEARGWTWPGSTCHFWTRWIRNLRSWEKNYRFLWSWLLEVVRRSSGGGTNEVR